ncbi:MAG TPA: methyltransferase domain-containing protein, partial [Candidatus Eisenbacteria bacterium]|nr:methyltransferase domain-containing protein [Candidatus Eisenbacteria bacterium]
FPRATVLGVDILDQSLELARSRHAARFAPRLSFENQSVYELRAADGTYDLTVNRHVMHSIPHPERVLAELKRVTKRGGRLHIIAEDYGMLHFARTRPGTPDPRDFWHNGPDKFGAATGTDLYLGRHIYGHLVDLGLEEITIDYLPVDTLRVPRETFADILIAWRDGYAGVSAEAMGITLEESRAYFDQMIANIRDPRGYAVWMVPVVGARVP